MIETLVIGGTGAMGGRVVERLLRLKEAAVAVLTRNTTSDRALALLAKGDGRLRLVQGDVNDVASVRAAMRRGGRVFCNTDFFSSGSVLAEYEQGTAILEAARSVGVDRFIWSSLDNAVALTEGRIAAPHYDSKAGVAARIALLRSDEYMRKDADGWYTRHVSTLTTSPYFENFPLRIIPRRGTLPDGREGLIFSIPIGTGRYPLIALDDIAWFAAHMFDHWQSWGGRDLAVVGDAPTGAQIAATFERVTGIPAGYEAVPLQALRDTIPEVGHDFAGMFGFFQDYDVFDRARDIGLLKRLHPELVDFEGWLRRTGWSGEAPPA